MNEMMGPDDAVLSVWKPVSPVPAGYFQVIRRTFDTGLHVLVLVRRSGDGYAVVSAADHGTVKLSVWNEGGASTVPETIDIVRDTCRRWNEKAAVKSPQEPPAPKEYFYTDDKGNLSGPVLREHLFALIRSGTITWDAQVWENSRASTGLGKWQPLPLALGFPPEGSDDLFA